MSAALCAGLTPPTIEDRRVRPEFVVRFLEPRGNITADGALNMRSRRGCTELNATWRVVKPWEARADDLLAAGAIGLIPWVARRRFDGPPETIVRRCRAHIDRDAPPVEHDNALVESRRFRMASASHR
jgi:hypothetical protein